MAARTHTQKSLRAKGKESVERKVVFKSVLDNPFRVRWPSVPDNLQNMILAHLMTVLEGLAEYNGARSQANRKRKRALHGGTARKKPRTETPAAETMPVDIPADDSNISDPPEVYKHLLFGINEVTKRLEEQIKSRRCERIKPSSAEDATSKEPYPIKLLFVCRADVDPPILIDHLPHLVASFNSTTPDHPVVLIPLPKDAESRLAAAIGVRRVAVLALDALAPNLSNLDQLVEPVPRLSAPWLTTAKQFVPTHIKQLRTTAPKDMKAMKEKRAACRAAAKQKQKRKAAD